MGLLRRAYDSLVKQNPQRLPSSSGLFSGGLFNAGGGISAFGMMDNLTAPASAAWLFAVIDRISSAVIAATWTLKGAETRQGDRPVIVNHPVLSLWAAINPFMTRDVFLDLVVQYYFLTGESPWYKARRSVGRPPEELWPLRPDLVRPAMDKEGYVVGYIYSGGGMQVPIPAEDIAYLLKPSPLTPYRGQGVIQALMPDLRGERYAATWNANFFRQSAEPGGVIEFDRPLSDDEFERLRLRWQTQHQGVANAHRVAIIEEGKWIDRKVTMRDMQFEQLRKFNRDIVLGALGMPRHIMGISEDVNRANAEAAEVVFTRWIIKPFLMRLRNMVNAYILPEFKGDLFFDFDDPVPENRALNMQIATEAYKVQLITRDEGRALLGLSFAKEGGSEFFSNPRPMQGLRSAKAIEGKALSRKALDPLVQAEEAMRVGWEKRLDREVLQLVQSLSFDAKSIGKLAPEDVDTHDWDWWTKYGDDVQEELILTFRIAFEQLGVALGPSLADDFAIEYARTRTAQLLRIDGSINLVQATRLRVKSIISQALEEGRGISEITTTLRRDFSFSTSRADMIARTETATSLGQGHKKAALQLGHREKAWKTQNDDLVEAECRRNEAAGWIAISDSFPAGVDTIPQHPRCRCVVRFRTASPREGRLLAEYRCNGCNKLLDKDIPADISLWCPRCKKNTEASIDKN